MMPLMEMKRIKLALAFYQKVKKLKENVKAPILVRAWERETERHGGGGGERERGVLETQGLSCFCCGGHTQTQPNLWHYLRSNLRQQMRHHCLASFLGLGTHYMLNWGMHYEALSSPFWNQLRNKQIKTFSDQGFSLTLWSRYYDCSHFVDKATKAEAGEVICPRLHS